MDCKLELSVVMPVFNEADTLPELYAQLTKALQGFRYELLFVDDGSVDESYEILANLHASDHRVKVMRLAGNYGQHAALSAGIECAKGQVIVSLDADLQCAPDDIPTGPTLSLFFSIQQRAVVLSANPAPPCTSSVID